MALTVQIWHRVNEPSGVVAQLLDANDVVEERKFDEDDQDDQELLREATVLAAAGDTASLIRLLFPDRLP
jgi:hypothetical protein